MIADAVHSLSDFATDIVVLVFVRISNKPNDKDHNYGHGKYETLASTIIGLALMAVAVGIIVKGAKSVAAWVQGETLEMPGSIAFWAAIASIVIKELTYRYTVHFGKKLNSQAVIANAWHHRSDALSSIGTALGIGLAILLGDRWAVLDPIASLIVGAFIVKVAYELISSSLDDLMEKALPENIENEILEIVNSYPDIKDPHNLFTRRIGNQYAIEIHVRMDGNCSLFDAHARTTDIEKALKGHFGEGTHVTIHIEPIK